MLSQQQLSTLEIVSAQDIHLTLLPPCPNIIPVRVLEDRFFHSLTSKG